MKIKKVHFVEGYSSFYFDDQVAIKKSASQDGFVYVGEPVTAGFQAIRQAGECISILLELENGAIAQGDCAAVQYSGAGGRDPVFRAATFIPLLEKHLRPHLLGLNVDCFLENATFFEALELDGKLLHTAIRYGISQALLDATALASNRLKTEILCAEYKLGVICAPIQLFGQSGDDRYTAVDKMILKSVDSLPHGLINNIPDKLGRHGEKLSEYVSWLTTRIRMLRPEESYKPSIHLDVYGTIGIIFQNNIVKIADYLARLQSYAAPFHLYIEGPIDAGEKSQQIDLLGALRRQLDENGVPVKIVADEWCNTYEDIVDFVDAQCCHMAQIKTPDLGGIQNALEAVLYCRENKVEAYLGGTCNETDISARTCVHVALASRPERMLVKPGMGFDEGMTIVANEMARSLSILKNRV